MSKEKQINNCKNCNSQKEEKIKELAKDLCNSIVWTDLDGEPLIDAEQTCAALYSIGYRKQSEGDWIWDKEHSNYKCSLCGEYDTTTPNFCRDCGAKMFVRMTHTCPHNIPNLIPIIEEMKGGTYAI